MQKFKRHFLIDLRHLSVQVHGPGRWRHPVNVRAGVLLRGATASHGVDRHRNAAVRGLPVPNVRHDQAEAARLRDAGRPEALQNDAHLLRHILQFGKVHGARATRPVRVTARGWCKRSTTFLLNRAPCAATFICTNSVVSLPPSFFSYPIGIDMRLKSMSYLSPRRVVIRTGNYLLLLFFFGSLTIPFIFIHVFINSSLSSWAKKSQMGKENWGVSRDDFLLQSPTSPQTALPLESRPPNWSQLRNNFISLIFLSPLYFLLISFLSLLKPIKKNIHSIKAQFFCWIKKVTIINTNFCVMNNSGSSWDGCFKLIPMWV